MTPWRLPLTGLLVLMSATLFTPDDADAQPADANYDEAKVPAYTLPDPLTGADGRPVTTAKDWTGRRRAEVLRLFEDHVYGRQPAAPKQLAYEVVKTEPKALNGAATRKEVSIYLTGSKTGPTLNLLLFIPNQRTGPVPAFVGLSFNGNQAVHPDPGITLSTAWMRPGKDNGVVNNRATEASRGVEASRWPVEMIIGRGYALATAYYGDIEPDHAEGWKTGLRAALGRAGADTQFAGNDWGAIGAWAWGLSRMLDYLEKDGAINARQTAVIGHSRLGKTSLWAGATDERFGIVISNNSGCGGAALSRRAFGETVARINKSFPHWFCDNFEKYNQNEAALPVDQHELIALMAPRPVYVASAEEDRWADPRGEFLSALHAEPVYRLFGKGGLGVKDLPPVNQPVGEVIGYHIRTGKHDINEYDWTQYLNFADRHFRPRKK